MHSQDNDTASQSRRAPEVEELLNSLKIQGSGAADASVNYRGWDKKSRPKTQPSFEPIAIRSDNHHTDPNEANPHAGLMLVEAALLPNLSYVGVGTQSAPKSTKPGCFFYPNGKKSKYMRNSIQDSLRQIHEDSLNAPKRTPNNDIVSFGKSLEKSYSHLLEKEIFKQRNQHLKSITNYTGKPLRTSLVDRPLTAASTSSVMKQRGKILDGEFTSSGVSFSSASSTSPSTNANSSSKASSSRRQRPFTTGTGRSSRINQSQDRERINLSKESLITSSSRPSSTSSTRSDGKDVRKMNNAELKRFLKSSNGRLEIAMMQQHPASQFY